MLTKTITYTDFNDVERTEEFCFNLTEAEVIELEVGEKEGLSDFIKKIVAADDRKELVALFKKLILAAYGQRTADGRGFTKSPVLSAEFACTNAYSNFFMECATNEQAAIMLVNGIMPQGFHEKVKDQAESAPAAIASDGDTPKKPQDMTREELLALYKDKSDSINDATN